MSNENIDSPVDYLQQGHYMERDSLFRKLHFISRVSAADISKRLSETICMDSFMSCSSSSWLLSSSCCFSLDRPYIIVSAFH